MNLNRNIIKLLLIFTLLISVSTVSGQSKSSIYSMFGIGQLTDNSYGINKSFGGTGIAFKSGRSINFMNPASYLGINPNSFSVEIGVYGSYSVTSNSSKSQATGDVNFSYFSASSYFTDWWVFSFGILPFSVIDYKITATDGVEGELETYEKYFMGSGGFNRIYAGSSFKVYKGLSLGLNASLVFGKVNQTEITANDTDYLEYELTNTRTANGFYLDYGAQYSIAHKNWEYTVGAIYGAGKKLNTKDDLEFTSEDETTALDQSELPDIEIPQKAGFGLAAKNGNIFRVGIDYEWKNWATVSFLNSNVETQNSNRVSAGLEYAPGQARIVPKGFYYRLGGNYKSSHLRLKNTPINSYAVNLGLGIPYGQISIFNLALEYGESGTHSSGLLKDRYLELYCNFSLHEFLAIKKDKDSNY